MELPTEGKDRAPCAPAASQASMKPQRTRPHGEPSDVRSSGSRHRPSRKSGSTVHLRRNARPLDLFGAALMRFVPQSGYDDNAEDDGCAIARCGAPSGVAVPCSPEPIVAAILVLSSAAAAAKAPSLVCASSCALLVYSASLDRCTLEQERRSSDYKGIYLLSSLATGFSADCTGCMQGYTIAPSALRYVTYASSVVSSSSSSSSGSTETPNSTTLLHYVSVTSLSSSFVVSHAEHGAHKVVALSLACIPQHKSCGRRLKPVVVSLDSSFTMVLFDVETGAAIRLGAVREPRFDQGNTTDEFLSRRRAAGRDTSSFSESSRSSSADLPPQHSELSRFLSAGSGVSSIELSILPCCTSLCPLCDSGTSSVEERDGYCSVLISSAYSMPSGEDRSMEAGSGVLGVVLVRIRFNFGGVVPSACIVFVRDLVSCAISPGCSPVNSDRQRSLGGGDADPLPPAILPTFKRQVLNADYPVGLPIAVVALPQFRLMVVPPCSPTCATQTLSLRDRPVANASRTGYFTQLVHVGGRTLCNARDGNSCHFRDGGRQDDFVAGETSAMLWSHCLVALTNNGEVLLIAVERFHESGSDVRPAALMEVHRATVGESEGGTGSVAGHLNEQLISFEEHCALEAWLDDVGSPTERDASPVVAVDSAIITSSAQNSDASLGARVECSRWVTSRPPQPAAPTFSLQVLRILSVGHSVTRTQLSWRVDSLFLCSSDGLLECFDMPSQVVEQPDAGRDRGLPSTNLAPSDDVTPHGSLTSVAGVGSSLGNTVAASLTPLAEASEIARRKPHGAAANSPSKSSDVSELLPSITRTFASMLFGVDSEPTTSRSVERSRKARPQSPCVAPRLDSERRPSPEKERNSLTREASVCSSTDAARHRRPIISTKRSVRRSISIRSENDVPVALTSGTVNDQNTNVSIRGCNDSADASGTRTWNADSPEGTASSPKLVLDAHPNPIRRSVSWEDGLNNDDVLRLKQWEAACKQLDDMVVGEEPDGRRLLEADEQAGWLALLALEDTAGEKLRRREKKALAKIMPRVPESAYQQATTDSVHKPTVGDCGPLPPGGPELLVSQEHGPSHAFAFRSLHRELAQMHTHSARFMINWRRRQTWRLESSTVTATSTTPSVAESFSLLDNPSWLQSYLRAEKSGIPPELADLFDRDRCAFEVRDLELKHQDAREAIDELEEVVLFENEKRCLQGGALSEWIPLLQCPFQYPDGSPAVLDVLNPMGDPKVNPSCLWQWESPEWSVGEWSYAMRWPSVEPGDADHWSASSDVANVRRRIWRRWRVDCSKRRLKRELEAAQQLELQELKEMLGVS